MKNKGIKKQQELFPFNLAMVYLPLDVTHNDKK